VLTNIDLAAVSRPPRAQSAGHHRLTPVDQSVRLWSGRNRCGRQRPAFLEKPNADEITCDTINAGIYILNRTPRSHPQGHALVDRAQLLSVTHRTRPETFIAVTHRGYWIDIGTPKKYMQVHRDIMDRTIWPRRLSIRRIRSTVAERARRRRCRFAGVHVLSTKEWS